MPLMSVSSHNMIYWVIIIINLNMLLLLVLSLFSMLLILLLIVKILLSKRTLRLPGTWHGAPMIVYLIV